MLATFTSGRRRRTDDCFVTVDDPGDVRRLGRRLLRAGRRVVRGLPRGDAVSVPARLAVTEATLPVDD